MLNQMQPDDKNNEKSNFAVDYKLVADLNTKTSRPPLENNSARNVAEMALESTPRRDSVSSARC